MERKYLNLIPANMQGWLHEPINKEKDINFTKISRHIKLLDSNLVVDLELDQRDVEDILYNSRNELDRKCVCHSYLVSMIRPFQ